MITVMRQRSFYRPNGNDGSAKKAKGCSGIKLVVFQGILPYKAVSDGRTPKTPSMREIYKGLAMRYWEDPNKQKKIGSARKIRQRPKRMKMPIPAAYKREPRVRHVTWPGEQYPLLRYRYDGSIKE
jgi:hypothetical protein